ncbi:MAG: aldehyde dehydrogenase family protein [Myxococcales bacterium]|nr:aldehyde dehydrogenase family protein [Myxococcales bacterium]
MREKILADLRAPQRLFINGARCEAVNKAFIDIINPATGTPLTQVQAAESPDVDLAVQAARHALTDPAWSDMTPQAREHLMLRIADILEARAHELGTLEALNNGKTLHEGVGDVGPSADAFRYYGGWVRKLYGQTIPVDGHDLVYTIREPVGVCGLIVPWNYPLLMAAWKVAPALACGCTVVLKPSELTPLTALRLADICKEAGVPDGVVNVIPGYGEQAGAALAKHPDVDKIAFTGSVATARSLLIASANSNLKKVSLELGGKSPLIVFPDADLDAAAKAAFWGIFANKGEVCSASSRLLVHASVKAALVERLTAMANRMKVGDPFLPDTEMGALISQVQFDKVMAYIKRGIDEGAELVAGGERYTEGQAANGWFLRPTIFTNVQPQMTIAQEEIFGPVLSVLEFENENEALQLANSTIYGLVAAVFTRDISRAHRVAKSLQSGVVWINRWNGFDSGAPFGGAKQSGWGRELGKHALDLYTQTKCVWVKL